MNFVSRTLVNGVRFDVRDEGGQDCYDFMTMNYRFCINIIMVTCS